LILSINLPIIERRTTVVATRESLQPMSKRPKQPAVAITGIGAISAYGHSAEAFYSGLTRQRPVIRPVTLPGYAHSGAVWWSTVQEFDPLEWMDERIVDGTDIVAQWGMAAAQQAMDQSALTPDPLRTAVVQGTSMCGVLSVMQAQFLLDTRGPEAFPRKTMMKALTNMGAAQLAMRYGLHGPSLTVTTACASSLDALGVAARMIASGQVDAAIVGGTEAGHHLGSGEALEGFLPALAYAPAAFGMQSSETNPKKACMPFDVKRSGIATSEGAAGFVLERVDLAEKRGAPMLGYLAGYGSVADAYHPSAPEPSGVWEARAMQMALDDAGMNAGRIDALYAHATGTPVGDTPEIRAINAVHRDRRHPLRVTSIKGHFGHAAAASGGLSLIAGLLDMGEGSMTNTANTRDPDPEAEFEVVLEKPRPLEVRAFQVNAFGFGGQNASIVVTRSPE
jgi:3-oxoacyl-[acyl-carrier-protein] synthase II